MKVIPLYMIRTLDHIPTLPFPEGYRFRLFHHIDDKEKWANIVTRTNEFSDIKQAITRFDKEFAPFIDETKQRMIFLETDEGETIGTVTAWFGKWQGEVIGRLHWVEIIPEYQGKKLGKPLVTEGLKVLKSFHEKAYLKTQATSLAAIHIYKRLGFTPCITSDSEKKVWEHVENKLNI